MSTQTKIDKPFPALSLQTLSGSSLTLGQPPTPMDSTETDQPFAEPGMFFIRPDGWLRFAEVASAPFFRPDLEMIKMGVSIIPENDYPARGTG